MLELIWRFRTPTLDDDSVMLPLMSAIAETPGFSAKRYDLNQKEQWRDFDLERAVVDALTQRTQLVRIHGDRDQAMAMIAMGKREEQPTAIIRLPDGDDIDALVARWGGLYEDLPLDSTLISSGQWRNALQNSGLPSESSVGLLGMVFGWRRAAAPQAISEMELDDLPDTPVRLDREANHLVLRLADRPQIDDEDHRRALEYVARRLMRA